MIPATHFGPIVDGKAWFVFESSPVHGVRRITDLDRPCDTCGGALGRNVYRDSNDPGCFVRCPDCIDGRHTFDVEVECEGPAGANIASTDGTFRRLMPVSVVPGMVLPIIDTSAMTDDELDDTPADFVEWDHPKNIVLWRDDRFVAHVGRQMPSAAAQVTGMWAVQVQVHS
jgi:hypothetical protein